MKIDERNYKVYMHTCNVNNKKYIGITCKDVNRRWRKNGEGYKGQAFYNAINKYGWKNFKHEILMDGLTQEEAERWEVALIAQHKSNDIRYGYNIDNGGNHNGKLGEITKEKLRIAKLGKPSKKRKAVVQMDLNYNVICEYESLTEAETKTNIPIGDISKVVALKSASAGGYIWRAKGEEERRFVVENDKRIRVYQYSLDGIFLKEYASIGMAAKENGMYTSDILTALKRKSRESKGYLWKRSDGDYSDISPFNPDDRTEKEKMFRDCRNRKTAKVIQMDLSGNVINIYNSIIEASKANCGLCYTNIVSCARGNRKTAGGYIWRYAS